MSIQRKKSYGDIVRQFKRISQYAIVGSRNGRYSSDKTVEKMNQARAISDKYLRNISKTKRFQREKNNGAWGTKYSQRTYMGLSKG